MKSKFLNLFHQIILTKLIFGLDILRAAAILFVVIGHGNYLLPKKWSSFINLFVFDGISIFFVLSGFLIGGILIKHIDSNGINKKTLFTFWIRRWFRTLPNYFLILLILCIINYLFKEGFTLQSVNRYFYFSQNLFVSHPSWFFPEAWSLCVEEWFYLTTPIIIALFHMLNFGSKKSFLFTFFLIIILVTAFRYYKYVNIPINTFEDWDLIFRKQVSTRLDSLMYGVMGAYISYYHKHVWTKYKNQLFVLGIFLFILSQYLIPNYSKVGDLYSTVFSFTLIAIATLFLLPLLSQLKSNSGLSFYTITYISVISYSMYLLNLSVIQFCILNKIPWNFIIDNTYIVALVKYSLYWILLIVFSTLLYKYFELPITRFRDNENIKKITES